MEHLEVLDLDFNNLQGAFPFKHAKIGSLERLDMNYNSLTGSLDFVNMFPKLKEAHLDNNEFSGTIPERLGELSNLRESCVVYLLICCVSIWTNASFADFHFLLRE
jgi:hypothetical protein